MYYSVQMNREVIVNDAFYSTLKMNSRWCGLVAAFNRLPASYVHEYFTSFSRALVSHKNLTQMRVRKQEWLQNNRLSKCTINIYFIVNLNKMRPSWNNYFNKYFKNINKHFCEMVFNLQIYSKH